MPEANGAAPLQHKGEWRILWRTIAVRQKSATQLTARVVKLCPADLQQRLCAHSLGQLDRLLAHVRHRQAVQHAHHYQ